MSASLFECLQLTKQRVEQLESRRQKIEHSKESKPRRMSISESWAAAQQQIESESEHGSGDPVVILSPERREMEKVCK